MVKKIKSTPSIVMDIIPSPSLAAEDLDLRKQLALTDPKVIEKNLSRSSSCDHEIENKNT